MIFSDSGRKIHRAFQILNALLPFNLPLTASHHAILHFIILALSEEGTQQNFTVGGRGGQGLPHISRNSCFHQNKEEVALSWVKKEHISRFWDFKSVTAYCPQHSPVENLQQAPSNPRARPSSFLRNGQARGADHPWFSPPSLALSPTASLQK